MLSVIRIRDEKQLSRFFLFLPLRRVTDSRVPEQKARMNKITLDNLMVSFTFLATHGVCIGVWHP